jgi:hypothetical protein
MRSEKAGERSGTRGGPGVSDQQPHRPQVKFDCGDDSVLKCQLKQLERSKELQPKFSEQQRADDGVSFHWFEHQTQ